MARMKLVGQYTDRFNQLTGQSLPIGGIYQSDGLLAHVQKRHPADVGNLSHVPSVISAPDYVGHNLNEPYSIELVKSLGDNIMVCVKLDLKTNCHYVASVYTITNAKLQNRIQSGRLKKY